MTTFSNSLAKPDAVHGATITSTQTASDGTQLTTSAGPTSIALRWDRYHLGGLAMQVDPMAATDQRLCVLPFAGAPQVMSGSILLEMSQLPQGAAWQACSPVSGSGYLAMLQVQTDGTAKVTSRQGVQVGATSTTKLKAGEVYRYDWSVTLGAAGSSSITAAVCRPDAAPMTPVAADLKVTSTAVDLSSYVAAGIQSVQWGTLNPGPVLGATWFAAPRADDVATPVTSWMPPVAYGQGAQPLDVRVTAGTVTASGTRSGEASPVPATDLAGALGDSDTATKVDFAAASTTSILMRRVYAGADVTLTLAGFTGSVQVQAYVDGAAKGSAKTTTSGVVTWTNAELGSPAPGVGHDFRFGVVA